MSGFEVVRSQKACNALKVIMNVCMFVFLVMYFVCDMSLTETSADTHVAASCSLANVQAAIAAASRGDTVSVPTCSETAWDSRLQVTKAITLRGEGAGRTTIKSSINPATYRHVAHEYTPRQVHYRRCGHYSE